MATIKSKIIALKKENPDMSAKVIAKKLGIKPHYVHTTMYMERLAAKKNAPKRTYKRKEQPTHDDVVVTVTDLGAFENDSLTTDLRSAEIADLRKEIESLTTIISYLERRCANWERLYGPAI